MDVPFGTVATAHGPGFLYRACRHVHPSGPRAAPPRCRPPCARPVSARVNPPATILRAQLEVPAPRPPGGATAGPHTLPRPEWCGLTYTRATRARVKRPASTCLPTCTCRTCSVRILCVAPLRAYVHVRYTYVTYVTHSATCVRVCGMFVCIQSRIYVYKHAHGYEHICIYDVHICIQTRIYMRINMRMGVVTCI